MDKEEFKIWAENAAAKRDTAIQEIDPAADAAMKMAIAGRLKVKLNDR